MKRKLMSIILVICVLIAVSPCLLVSAMTAQNGADWAKARIGWRIDTDGYYGAQCKDFVNAYCQENFGFTPPGNAKDLINYNYPSGWQKIQNTPDFLPQPGDIAVWTYGSFAEYGHCGIIVSANLSTFQSVDQNWYNANGETGSPAALVTHNYNGFWGVIRPNFTPPTPTIEPIHKDNDPHVRNGYCTIKNVASGKFLNVYAGSDANFTSVCMWSYDDSTDQHFRLDHKGNGQYKLYAYCSSRATNRVVDVNRGTDNPAEGDKVQLWTPDDDMSQLYYVWPVGNDEYVFELASKPGYVITPNGNEAAGQDGSQLILQQYTGAAYQKWKLCDNNGIVRENNINYAPGYYTVNTGGIPIVRRNAPDPYAEVISGHDIANGETVYVSQINDFWGYTDANGIGGWICLDYTKYIVAIESISISKMPNKTSFFVGDKFDSSGLEISVNYSNGQKEIINSDYSVSCDLSSAGEKTATVSYKGKSTTFTVNVQELLVDSISLQSTDVKKEYYVGESVDADAINLLVNCNNGSSNVITSGFTLDYDFSTPGEKKVTISYGGKSTSYDVIVVEKTTAKKANIKISSTECEAGNNTAVYVSLKGNGIYDGNMTIQYDASKLKINNVKTLDALKDKTVSINKEYANDKIRVSFSGTDVIPSDSDILKLEFSVLDGTEGTADISIAEAKLYDIAANSIDLNITNGVANVYPSVSNFEITNIQSETSDGMKIVTANVNNDNVTCSLAVYDENGTLIECDIKQPENGQVRLSVKEGQRTDFMVWSKLMRPLMNAITIY